MSIPKEPRQKMINMMYLVLTAMLALNVSAEILNAFKTVNDSLEKTNTVVNNSTNTIIASFQEKMTDPTTAEKARLWYPKAEQVVAQSKTISDYIEGLKNQILKNADFNPSEGDSSYKMDNLDVATRLMVDQGAGKTLLKNLTDYKASILNVDPEIKAEFANNLPINLAMPVTQNKGNNTWEAAYFRMVPTVAALTILSKFQNDIRTTENRVVSFLHNKVGQVAVRFDTYAAVIGQSSNYLMPGQELEITAGVGAFSKAAKPIITIGNSNAALGEDGAAHYKTTVSDVGTKSIPVSITYTDQEGKQQTIKKTVEYTVGQANASIALPKMNVLYIGVDNPVNIAASGGAEQLQVSISGGGGSISGSRGNYVARVNSITDECRISVSVDGKLAGAQNFRVRTIPDPVATVGGNMSGENVAAGAFKAQAGVGAYVKDFPFELQYRVTGFTVVGDTPDGDIVEAVCTGNTWSPQARTLINNLRPGALITIENIRATGPDGRSRKLPSLLYNIK